MVAGCRCRRVVVCCFFQAEDGILALVRSRGLGDVYKRQNYARIDLQRLMALVEPVARVQGSASGKIALRASAASFESTGRALSGGGSFSVERCSLDGFDLVAVSYTHLRAHETVLDLVCRLLLEKKKIQPYVRWLCVTRAELHE